MSSFIRRRMPRRLRSKKGAITLFLAIILAALILVETTFVAFLWDLDYRLAVSRALKAQAECVLADYNRELFNVYGIYAYSLQDVDDEIFNRVLEANGHKDGSGLTVYAPESFDADCLRRVIAEYYGYRLPGVMGSQLITQFGEVIKEIDKTGLIDKLKEFRGSKASEYLSDILSGASKLEQILSGIDEDIDISSILENSDLFYDFRQGLKDDSNDLDNTDIKQSLGDTGWILDSLNKFIEYNEHISDIGELTGMQLYCAHYASYNFDCRVPNESDSTVNGTAFSDIHENNEYDTEHLITGINGKAACLGISAAIHGALSGINFLKLRRDKKFTSVVSVVALVLSEVIAAVSEGMVEIPPKVMEMCITGLCASVKGLADLDKLEKGERISVFKENDTEYIKVSYRDFLFSFALLVPYPLVLPRMLEVLKREYGDMFIAVNAVSYAGTYELECYRKYEMYDREAFYEDK
jgi:hypothetical protein